MFFTIVSFFAAFFVNILVRASRLNTVFKIDDKVSLSLGEINHLFYYLFPQTSSPGSTSTERLTRSVLFLKKKLKHKHKVFVFLEAIRTPTSVEVTSSQLIGLIKSGAAPDDHIIAKVRKGYSYSQIVDSVGIVDSWADSVFMGKQP